MLVWLETIAGFTVNNGVFKMYLVLSGALQEFMDSCISVEFSKSSYEIKFSIDTGRGMSRVLLALLESV